jgi:hypothetical protein
MLSRRDETYLVVVPFEAMGFEGFGGEMLDMDLSGVSMYAMKVEKTRG